MAARVAKSKVRMCKACNGDFIEEFKTLLEGKENVVFEDKCVGGGKCGTKTPFCRVEKSKERKILEAATVKELADMIG